jgi:hypothetical protein
MKARIRQGKASSGIVMRLGTKAGTSDASKSCRHKQLISANVLFLLLLIVIACIYAVVVYSFYQHEDIGGTSNNANNQPNEQRKALRKEVGGPPLNTKYPFWRDLVVRLASIPAKEALLELRNNDPFGTRQFETNLLAEETKLGRLLEHSELQQLFSCPDSRITLPDQRDLQKARDFRETKPGTFLFFQHLRKAGGTHFCSLAQANLPKHNVAAYYCSKEFPLLSRRTRNACRMLLQHVQ